MIFLCFFLLFCCFWVSHAAWPKKTPKLLPGALPRASGELPGTLKSINFSSLGGPGAHPMNFLGPPGRHQERFGAHLAPTLGPHGAQKRPGGLQALIFDPPGTIFHLFLMIFDLFSHILLLRFVCVFVCVLVFAPFFFQASK